MTAELFWCGLIITLVCIIEEVGFIVGDNEIWESDWRDYLEEG
jgi:hypothetical protein